MQYCEHPTVFFRIWNGGARIFRYCNSANGHLYIDLVFSADNFERTFVVRFNLVVLLLVFPLPVSKATVNLS